MPIKKPFSLITFINFPINFLSGGRHREVDEQPRGGGGRPV